MKRLDEFQEYKNSTLLTGPENTISQTFHSDFNNLSSLRIHVFNPDLAGKDKYSLLISDLDGNPLRETEFTESNAGWNTEFRYDFTPISDSHGKPYKFTIAYTGDNKSDAKTVSDINRGMLSGNQTDKNMIEIFDKVQKNYINIAYSQTNNYDKGNAALNNIVLPGDLAFQTYHTQNPKGFIRHSTADLQSRISKDGVFFLFYGILLLFLVIIFLRKTGQKLIS